MRVRALGVNDQSVVVNVLSALTFSTRTVRPCTRMPRQLRLKDVIGVIILSTVYRSAAEAGRVRDVRVERRLLLMQPPSRRTNRSGQRSPSPQQLGQLIGGGNDKPNEKRHLRLVHFLASASLIWEPASGAVHKYIECWLLSSRETIRTVCAGSIPGILN